MRNRQQGAATLDELIEDFEQARSAGGADVVTYLPLANHPLYADALVELVRVDLEFCWREEPDRHLSDVRGRLPAARDRERTRQAPFGRPRQTAGGTGPRESRKTEGV